MISADIAISALKSLGVKFAVVLPDSRLWALEREIENDREFIVLKVTNEGEGFAICAGIWMGGKRAVLLIEDSGLYMGASALEKFGNQNEMPIVMIVGYHAPLGERNWFQASRAPITIPLLEALRIPYVMVNSRDKIDEIIKGAYSAAFSSKRPFAVLCGENVGS